MALKILKHLLFNFIFPILKLDVISKKKRSEKQELGFAIETLTSHMSDTTKKRPAAKSQFVTTTTTTTRVVAVRV